MMGGERILNLNLKLVGFKAVSKINLSKMLLMNSGITKKTLIKNPLTLNLKQPLSK